MVGMVGVGLHPLLREVEITYFMSEKYQWRGFTRAAVKALCSWCFSVSDIPYLILVTDSANTPSGKLAGKLRFHAFGKADTRRPRQKDAGQRQLRLLSVIPAGLTPANTKREPSSDGSAFPYGRLFCFPGSQHVPAAVPIDV